MRDRNPNSYFFIYIQFPQPVYSKDYSFPLWIILAALSTGLYLQPHQLTVDTWFCFWNLSSVLSTYVNPYANVAQYYFRFIVSFELGVWVLFVLFCKDRFGYYGLLHFHMNFETSLSISTGFSRTVHRIYRSVYRLLPSW